MPDWKTTQHKARFTHWRSQEGGAGGHAPSPEIGFRKKFLAAPLIFAIGTFRIFTVQLHVLTYESTVKRQGTDKWFQKAASYSTRKL